MIQKKVEVIGQDRFIPIGKALGWLARHVAVPAGDEFAIRTPKTTVYIPSAVILKKNYGPRYRGWSKRNVLVRDNFTCAYCGVRPTENNHIQMTIDHVVPRSVCRVKGINPNTWENTVTACKRCNTKKGGRTPEEAGMRFRPGYRPTRPIHNG